MCWWCNLGVTSVTAGSRMWAKANIRQETFVRIFFFVLWFQCEASIIRSILRNPVVAITRSYSLSTLRLFSCLHLTNVVRIGEIMHIDRLFGRAKTPYQWSFVRFMGNWTWKFIFGCHLPNGMRNRRYTHTQATWMTRSGIMPQQIQYFWICFTSDGRTSFGMGNG